MDILKVRFPNFHLHVENFPIGHNPSDMVLQQQDLAVFDGLSSCPNIVSITAKIFYEDSAATRRLMEVAMSCPNLEDLQLRIPDDHGRYDWQSNRFGSHDFGVKPADRLPPLRRLVYESRLMQSPLPLIPSTIWNWNRIQHLEIRGRDMVKFVASIRGQVKHLLTLKVENFMHPTFGLRCDEEDHRILSVLDYFILDVNGLVDLEVVHPTIKLPLSTFAHLGTSLQRLDCRGLRHPYPWSPYRADGTVRSFPFSAQDINSMADSLSLLSSLTIDVLVYHDIV